MMNKATTGKSVYRRKTSFDYRLFLFFGALVLLIFFAVFWEPCPSPAQLKVFQIVIAIGVAGLAAALPGFIRIKYKNMVSAGGALAVFFIIYTLDPAEFVKSDRCSNFDLVIHLENEAGEYRDFQNQLVGISLGPHRIDPKMVNENGEVIFDNLVADYQDDSIRLRPVDGALKVVRQSAFTPENNREITFVVRFQQKVSGYVKLGDKAISNALIIFDNRFHTTTDQLGIYEIDLDLQEGQVCEVRIIYQQQEILNRRQVITSANPVNFLINEPG